jgi:hypothetical protein
LADRKVKKKAVFGDPTLLSSFLFLKYSFSLFLHSILSFPLSLSCQPPSKPLSSFSFKSLTKTTAGLPLPPPLLRLPHHPCPFVPLRSSFTSPLPDVSFLPRLPAKRKASEEPDGPHDSVSSSSKDFEAGRVTCEACGDSVSYRDELSGAFTTKHWDAHKLGW